MLDFTDDAKLVAELLRRYWPEVPGVDPPAINYQTEAYMVDSRVGSIFVTELSVPENVASSDYSTVTRTSRVSIRVSCRFRERMVEWSDTVCRCLYEARRAGWDELAPYTFLDITTRRLINDGTGWYTSVIDIKLTGYHIPLDSDGLGQKCL